MYPTPLFYCVAGWNKLGIIFWLDFWATPKTKAFRRAGHVKNSLREYLGGQGGMGEKLGNKI